MESYAAQCSAIDTEHDAIEASGRALAIWRELGDLDRAGRIMAIRSYFLWSAARNEEAHEAVREAVALLEHRPDSPALAAAYTWAAYIGMLGRDIPGAIQIGTRAIELAERYGETVLLARALNAVGSAQWFADPDQAEPTLTRSLETARRSEDDTAVASAMANLGSGAGEIRRYRVADHWLREAIAWCRQRDLDGTLHYGLAWLARSHFEQGRWSEAGTAATEAAQPTALVPARIVALTVLGRLRARRGDPDVAAPLAEAWQLAVRTGDLQRLWPVAAGRAEAAWLAGQPEQIPALVDDIFELAAQLGHAWAIGEFGFWRWRSGFLAAAPPGAAAPYALQINGYWLGAAGAWDEVGCPYEAATTRADSQQPDDLLGALEVLNRLGARPAADLLTARLRELGIRRLPRRPHRGTVDNPGGLTDRELEVLSLLAAGLSNADIAARLHISPKTAGHHVSAILGKLDVTSRREAVRTAQRWGIQPGP